MSGSDKTVVAFLIFPTKVNNFNVETLRGGAVVKSLRDTIHDIQNNIGKRIYDICLSGRLPESEELLLKEDTVRLKRCIYAAQRTTLPPITTHNVTDDAADPVLNNLRRCNLFNERNDRVKVGSFLAIDATQFSRITTYRFVAHKTKWWFAYNKIWHRSVSWRFLFSCI